MWLISCTYFEGYHCTLFCSDWMMYSVVSLSSRSLTNPPLIAGISIHIKIDSSSVLGLMSFIMLSYDIIASFDCSTLLRAAIYLLWLSIVISGISFDSWNLKSILLTCWIFGSISWRDWIILSNDIFSVGYAWPGKYLVLHQRHAQDPSSPVIIWLCVT